MKPLFTLALVVLAVPGSLSAKGNTVKILINSPDTSRAVEISDEAVRQFGVWEGPGTFINGVEQAGGFIIDWSKGAVATRPEGLQRYEVSFYIGCKLSDWGCRTTEQSLAYVVIYEPDPATGRGYVYLAGRTDPWFRTNAPSIARPGCDGKWFLANDAWQQFVASALQRLSRY